MTIITEAEKRWEKASEILWGLLDDIDTASDMFKPSDEEGYKAFYKYAMRKASEREKVLRSLDGYTLSWTPGFNDSDQHIDVIK